ncbi:unnamed protein product [Discosporangium mesarthrocarpum]
MFGRGKVCELRGLVQAANADLVFVNTSLSGLQQMSLQNLWGGASVLDRSAIILDIFANRARTTEAKLQVELARLRYEAARLVNSSAGRDSGFDRQRGGLAALGGAGEKALETRRRLLRDKMAEVEKKLEAVKRRRETQILDRRRRRQPSVALVGYTNAGKSTLLNCLSRKTWGSGGVEAKDRVFDTLDPTVRGITLPSMARCCLIDTVGFIQDLPVDICRSFHATLEEVRQADLLLHVRDASIDAVRSEAQHRAVMRALEEVGAGGVPLLEVWNKIDKVQERLCNGRKGSLGKAPPSVLEMEGGGGMDLPEEGFNGSDSEPPCNIRESSGFGNTYALSGKGGTRVLCVSSKEGVGVKVLLEGIDALLHGGDRARLRKGPHFGQPWKEQL